MKDWMLEFLKIYQIPVGPLLLRDYGDQSLFAGLGHHAYQQADESAPKPPDILT